MQLLIHDDGAGTNWKDTKRSHNHSSPKHVKEGPSRHGKGYRTNPKSKRVRIGIGIFNAYGIIFKKNDHTLSVSPQLNFQQALLSNG